MCQTEMCAQVHQKICARISIAAIFIDANSGNNLNAHQQQSAFIKCDMFIQRNTIQ